MKKLLLAIVLIFAVSLLGYVYIDEGFESGAFDIVTVTDVDGDGNNWQVSDIPVKGGAYWAESSSAGLTPDNEMLFPSTWMELDAYLNFWIGGTDAGSPEHYEIYIADDNIDPTNFILIHEETLASDSLKNVEISLRPYFLQLNEWFYDSNISIKIRHYNTDSNGGAASSLVLDDFRVIYYPTFNYGYPAELEQGSAEPFKPIHLVWDFWDFSTYDIEGNYVGWVNPPKVYYILTDEFGAQPVQEIELLPVDPASDFWWTYYCDIPGFAMGTKIEYWCEVIDNSPYALKGVSNHLFADWGEVNFEEGFEGGVMPDGWTSFQIGDAWSTQDKPWEVDVARQNVHTGSFSCTSASQNNFGVWVTEDYLVTPVRRINGAPTLKYFINAQTVEGLTEKWSVLISTETGDSIDVADFVEIANDSIVPGTDQTVWYEKTIFLGDYSEQYVRIMWKHIYTPLDKKLDRFLNIDDISIAEMPKYIMGDNGNVALPDEDFEINLTATDYSGINNVTVYYTLEGQAEASIVMTDNGDDSFTAYIPGQPVNTKCSWYAVVTDDSNYSNTTTTGVYNVIWFSESWLEWGSDYSDWPEPMNNGNKAAMDWNFGTKENLYIDKIEVGLAYDATDLIWRVVEFDETPTDVVIGDLQGTHTFLANGDLYDIEDGKNALVNGHIALEFEFPSYNEIMLDESGDKTHAWQWNSVTQWTTNLWGAFYIRMYVTQTGIEDEFVSSTTELCQNYPNPFNPTTSISFYNRIAGDVKLSVYNTKGEIVATLIDGKMNEGFRKVDFNASKLNSGVYYYTLRTPEKTLTKKMVLVK